MTDTICPMCEMADLLTHPDHYECNTCGHEWPVAEDTASESDSGQRLVKDAHGNILQDGDIVAMIKDLKLKGSSEVLKIGTKSKPIRLVDGDHEISCKMNGIAIGL